MSWFSKFIVRPLRNFFSRFWDNVSPSVKANLEDFADSLGDIVVAAVTAQIARTVAGEVKFKDAVQNVIDEAKFNGIAVSKIFAGKLVQDAVAAITASQGQKLVGYAVDRAAVEATALVEPPQ